MNQCQIRLATETDASAINEVSRHLGYTSLTDNEAKAKLAALIHSEKDKVYVAEVSGRIVGWLHLFYAHRLASEDFYEIGGLVVSPEVRKQGIGRKLVQRVADEHDGKLRVRCNEIRTETHQFYEQLGFITNKSQRIFDKER